MISRQQTPPDARQLQRQPKWTPQMGENIVMQMKDVLMIPLPPALISRSALHLHPITAKLRLTIVSDVMEKPRCVVGSCEITHGKIKDQCFVDGSMIWLFGILFVSQIRSEGCLLPPKWKWQERKWKKNFSSQIVALLIYCSLLLVNQVLVLVLQSNWNL